MKTIHIIGNWKSYKTQSEVRSWFEEIAKIEGITSIPETTKVVICPPYHFLPLASVLIQQYQLPFLLGAQDVSPFDIGSYTSAIAAVQLAELVTYCIVGHSERRRYFHETDEDVIAKVKQLLAQNITPVLCISDIEQLRLYLSVDDVLIANAEKIVFVYEPPSAISGGGAFHAEDPETIDNNAAEIGKMIGKDIVTIYGGSVNSDNAQVIFGLEHIFGGLPGQASLDPTKFAAIITQAHA